MKKESFVAPLLLWFQENGRDLPWRRSYDPYHVFISEIMLQQTQMERGLRYFKRWIARFPDIAAVADADENEILKYWEGLGYYRRAKNLHKAARLIVDKHLGQIPCEPQTLLRLPGVGAYTAAAVASIAGGHDLAAVDANFCRVFSRLYDINQGVSTGSGKKEVERLADLALPAKKARQFNQALMDFGSLVCKNRNPQCHACPLRDYCLAFARNTVAKRPVKTASVKYRRVFRLVGLIYCKKKILIVKRGDQGLWAGLWDLPGAAIDECQAKEEDLSLAHRILLQQTGLDLKIHGIHCRARHQYTTNKAEIICYLGRPKNQHFSISYMEEAKWRWVDMAEKEDYAFPAGIREILAKAKIKELAGKGLLRG